MDDQKPANLNKFVNLLQEAYDKSIVDGDYVRGDEFIQLFNALLQVIQSVKDEGDTNLQQVLSAVEGRFTTLQSEYKRVSFNVGELSTQSQEDLEDLRADVLNTIGLLKTATQQDIRAAISAIKFPEITPEEIITKLKKPKGKERLPTSAIEGIDDLATKEQLKDKIQEVLTKIANLPKGGGEKIIERMSSSFLKQLRDVDYSTEPTNGQALVWNATLMKWKPGTVSGGGGGSSQWTDTTGPTGITYSGGQVSISGGSIWTTGMSTPSAGVGFNAGYYAVGGYAFFQGYNYSTAAYIPVHIESSQLNLNAASGGRVTIGSATTGTQYAKLAISGSDAARVSVEVQNTNASGNASFYFQNDRGSFAAYGGLLTGGSADVGGTLFGLARADRTFLISDGASSAGFAIGTLTDDPLVFGTNNAERMRIAGDGVITASSSLNSAYGIYLQNTNAGSTARTIIQLKNNTGSELAQFSIFSSTHATLPNTALVESTKSFRIGTDAGVASGGTSTFQVVTGGYNVNPAFTISGTGTTTWYGTTINTEGDANDRFAIYNTAANGENVGSSIKFGGNYEATNSLYAGFASIGGVKENATAGNYAGALRLMTRVHGGTLTEWVRLTSGGSLGIGTTTPTANIATTKLAVGNTTVAQGVDVDVFGNGYSRIWFRDTSRAVNQKNYEMLNFEGRFHISRGDDANTTRGYRLALGETGVSIMHSAVSTAWLDLAAGTTASSPLRLREGVAPTTPNNGDVWLTTTHVYARIGGVSYQLDQQSGAGGMSIGGSVTSGTAGSVLFVASGPVLAQDNDFLNYDSATGTFRTLNIRNKAGSLLSIGTIDDAAPSTLTFTSGNATTGNAVGGAMSFIAGNGVGTGVGGGIAFTGGTGGATNADGGTITFTGGPGTGTGVSGSVSFNSASNTMLLDPTGLTVVGDAYFDNDVGIGITPAARLHLPAGTATAGTAPLRFTSGTALTTAVDGTMEYHSSHLYFTIGTTRYQLDQQSGGGVSDGDKGDITVSASGATWTIDNDVVTYAKMQNVSATSRFLGRITTGSGDVEELTGTQATSLLNVFTSALPGLVPAGGESGGLYLQANGTWSTPAAAIAIGSSVTSATPGSIFFAGTGPVLAQDNANLFWDDTNNYLGLGVNSSLTARLHLRTTGLGFTTTEASGLLLENNTASVLNNSQYSPQFTLAGTAWQTATGTSQVVKFRQYIQTSYGDAASTGKWVLDSSINGGAYAMPLVYSSLGRMGIGTEAPQDSLHVSQSVNDFVGMRVINTSTGTSAGGQLTVGQDNFIGAGSYGALRWVQSTNVFGGLYRQSSLSVESTGAGGLNFISSHASSAAMLWSKGYGTNDWWMQLNMSTGFFGVAIVPTSTFHVGGSFSTAYRAITAARTLDATDQLIEVTSGTFNVTLPTAVGITGREYTVKNTGAGTTTLATTSSQTIDGVTTKTILTNESMTVTSNGANWIKI